jgi:hypothetical protein
MNGLLQLFPNKSTRKNKVVSIASALSTTQGLEASITH